MTNIVQMSKGGTNFYPKTHVQAVVGLPDFSSFEKASDVQTAISNAISPLQTQVNNSAVGTNLLLGTSKTLNTVTNAWDWNNGMPVYKSNVTTVNSDTPYTARVWISPASHNMAVQVVWKDSSGNTHYGSGSFISAGTSGYSTWTDTITANSVIQHVTIVFSTQQSTASSVSYGEAKLEKGSVATDWCPNPSEIATNDGVQAEIAGQIKANQPDLSGFQKASDVQTAITSALGKVDVSQTMNTSIRNKLQNMNKEMRS